METQPSPCDSAIPTPPSIWTKHHRFLATISFFQCNGEIQGTEELVKPQYNIVGARNDQRISSSSTSKIGQGLKPLCIIDRGNQVGNRSRSKRWRQERSKEVIDRLDRQGIASLLQGQILLSECKRAHAHIIRCGLQQDTFFANLLVNAYGKCGALEDARLVFDKIAQRNVVSWNAMIAVYAQHSCGKEALQLFRQMQQEGVKPSKITFICVLRACDSHAALAEGKMIHSCIVDNRFQTDVVVGTALVNMYSKCGCLEDARSVFDKLHQRNVVSWTAMIAAYTQHGHGKKALEVFRQMQQEGVTPNKVTFISVLGACDNVEALGEGEVIHACIVDTGLESDALVGTALVNMYGKCGSLEAARSIFEKIRERDVVSWNAMISAYVQHGHCKEALQLFWQMQQEGVLPSKITFINILGACDSPAALAEGKVIHACIVNNRYESDVVVRNALLNMYGKCGTLHNASLFFDSMLDRDVVSWTSMITAYGQRGHSEEALQLFRQMKQEGIEPSKSTFISALTACAGMAALAEGKVIHACIVDGGLESGDVGTALVSMYSKCGNLVDARSVFDRMHQRNVVSWNAMIAAYAQHGHGKAAIQLFQQMQQAGMKPDRLTFVSLLNACSHAGLVDEGCCYFVSMSKDHGITPMLEHYSCMVDLFGRAGQLDAAEDFIYKMPLQPDASMWRTLLGACRIHGDLVRGKRVAERAFNLDPQNSSLYVLLSNIYATAGRWDDVAKVRKFMVEGCAKETRAQLDCH